MSGYLSAEYAASLAEFGEPWPLTRAGGWLLRRVIPDTNDTDAMGLYPRCVCRQPERLSADLDAWGTSDDAPVSVALVTDPFAEVGAERWSAWFPDRAIPFKSHFVVDLAEPLESFVTSHHRYYTRVAQRSVHVEPVADLASFLDDWDALYACLAERHGLTGIKRFSRSAFSRQLHTPGVLAFRAVNSAGNVVGGQLWYVDGERAYNHLAASNAEGYAANASYALYDAALRHFAGHVRWLDLGAGAGLDPGGRDGLSQFKRGWSNAVRTVYFCGRVLRQDRYDELVRLKHPEPTSYFPAYRAGEFA